MAEEMPSPDEFASESAIPQEDEEYWLNEKQKQEEISDNNDIGPTLEKYSSQESNDKTNVPMVPVLNRRESMDDQSCDDSGDEDIVVTIDKDALAAMRLPNRSIGRIGTQTITAPPIKPQVQRGVDIDAPGTINGQSTFDFDINGAFKDEEKPWKKPGADISDYFNYGFTEETWGQYCDRQRRLKAENNLARLNPNPMVPVNPMMPGHPQMMHTIPQHPLMIVNKHQVNPPIMHRPFIPQRKLPDGKIDVIGATDQTSRRQIFEGGNNFDHFSVTNPPGFTGNQPANGQTVGDLVTTPPATNGPPPGHGTPPGNNHPIQTLGGHRIPLMPQPGPGMQFRPPYVHPHMPGAAPFYPHPPGGPLHGDRPQHPYFISHHPPQPWDKPNVAPVHGFNPAVFPGQPPSNLNVVEERPGPNRSPKADDSSPRSSTPEEIRPTVGGTESDKSLRDNRYKDRYKDDRDHHSSTRRRSSPKEHSSSSFRSRRRSGDHEYERPRSDRKSSRDRDDKYERYSRKRHHRDESGRHHRSGDDDPSRSHRSARRSPSKNFSSPPKSVSSPNNQSNPSEISQGQIENNEGQENEPNSNLTNSSSSPNGRSRREDSERSSSRHGHHKKSSKRSRRESGDERTGHHHRRRSREKSSTTKKSSNSTDSTTAESKEQINE